jgi:uncharacterized OB-fold protein
MTAEHAHGSRPADISGAKEPAMSTDLSTDLFGPGEPGDPTYLLGSLCRECGRAEFPRRAECAACGEVSDPVQIAGPARLRVSSAVLAQPPGSKVEAPYGVGVAEFSQSLCVIGLLVGDIQVGATVEVVVHEPYESGRIFAFQETAGLPVPSI